MLVRFINIVLLLCAITGFSTPALSQQTSTVLTNFDFTIVGVGIGVSPEYQGTLGT